MMLFALYIGSALAGACRASVFASKQTVAPTRTYPPIDLSPIFPTPISDVPQSDFFCWTSHISWSLHSSWVSNAKETDKIKITSSPLVSTYTGDYTGIRPQIDTTLCDGYPRVTSLATPTGTYPVTTITVDTTWISTLISPSPTCTVEPWGSICSKSYASSTSITSRLKDTEPTTYPEYLLKPPCTTPDTYPRPSAPVTCSLETSALTYKMLYWPVQTVGDICAGGGSTVTPSQTIPGKPNTARYGDLEMTSPTVYYILDGLQMKSFAGLYHSNRASAWLPLDPLVNSAPITLSQDPRQTPVSSARISCNLGRVCSTTLYPFSLEDLATAPASKYYGLIGGNDPIYQGWYSPYYTLPTGMPTRAGNWDVCGVMVTGWVKPTYVAVTTAS